MHCVQETKIESLRSLIAELERGVEIIRDLEVAVFRAKENGNGSIGAHFRHNLDFINAFLKGIGDGRIDYNDRPRDTLIETRPSYAVERMHFAMRRLERLKPEMLDRIVMVRSEIDEDAWHVSSIARELEFLHSHTVHHYAVVARLMPASERVALSTLGVAPSTLRYQAAGIGNAFVTQ